MIAVGIPPKNPDIPNLLDAMGLPDESDPDLNPDPDFAHEVASGGWIIGEDPSRARPDQQLVFLSRPDGEVGPDGLTDEQCEEWASAIVGAMPEEVFGNPTHGQ